MKINVVAVGKIKEKFYSDALTEYSKRISRFADFGIVEAPEAQAGKTPAEQIKTEGEALLSRAKGHIIALDQKGAQLTSVEFASYLKNKAGEGISEFSFLIGGSNGHAQSTLDKADLVLSFGKFTYPHQLFRVILAEQIYRGLSINANLPYHK